MKVLEYILSGLGLLIVAGACLITGAVMLCLSPFMGQWALFSKPSNHVEL